MYIETHNNLTISLKHQRDKDRPRIKVKAGKNKLIDVPGADPDKIYLTFSVANTGEQDYTVSIVGIALGKRSGGLVIPQPIGTVSVPYLLQKDATCDFWTEYDSTFEKLKNLEYRNRKRMKIRAYVNDYTGRLFYSDWISIDFEDSKFWDSVDSLKAKAKRILIKLLP